VIGASEDPAMPAIHRFGTMVFLMAGAMFFAGLTGGYLVFRFSGQLWPVPGLPALPVGLAGFNTLVIVASSLALVRAERAMRALDAVGLRRGLAVAAALGATFLLLQAVQWWMLLSRGLSFAGTTYGSIFYVLTGAHAVHATVGVLWLLLIAWRQREVWVPGARQKKVEVCALFWHFVGVVWVCLYAALYLL
jgi:cytochrome c oxidase subunit 3